MGISDLCANFDFLRFHDVDRQLQLDAALFRKIDKFIGEIDFVRLHAALTNRNPLRFEECVRHRPANQNRVGLFHEGFEHADFVGNLGAPHDDEERFGRLVEFLVQIFQFLLH